MRAGWLLWVGLCLSPGLRPGLVLGAARAEGPPSEHTLIYYNARMALREGKANEAVRLWLLRNTLEDQTGRVSAHDADFHSVTWAALGELGVCPDGLAEDDDGAGLWPLALHNWVVRNMSRRSWPGRTRPFDAFQVGRQQRVVSIGDVLSAGELSSVHLSRGKCMRQRLAKVRAGEGSSPNLSDRQVTARLLRYLLDEALGTLAPERVRGRAVLEARLFDIDLQLTELAAREARRDAREAARDGRQLGLGPESIAAMTAEAPVSTLDLDSEAARVLRRCETWPTSEWMALSPDRRRFLFHSAVQHDGDPVALERIALGILDRLIDSGEGEEVERWIAGRPDPSLVWGGARGLRLLALDRESGFRERSVIALHRGVAQLEQGDLPAALCSMAFALQHAPESRASDEAERLSRRWLSNVAAQFEITDELLLTLEALVPRRDYALLLEDLMWRATFRADAPSFARGLRHQPGRGALMRRLDLLEPLAAGNMGLFATRVRAGLQESPSETLRFLTQMLERLELEDADVRAHQIPTLRAVRGLVLSTVGDASGRQGRTAAALADRCQAIVEGLVGPGPDMSDRARALAPATEVYAGSVRLAPADPLPWPFRESEPGAPSIFTPIELKPIEWRDASGELVFGWSIRG